MRCKSGVSLVVDDAKENEELTTSCANSEPSPHNSPSTPAKNESKGNERKATLKDGEAFS